MNDTPGTRIEMLDVYDAETGTVLMADGRELGKDSAEARAIARELADERERRTRYRKIPPWKRDIAESVWLNDYFRSPGKGYQDTCSIMAYTTEVANGFRFACESRGYLLYDSSSRIWRAWSGTCWKKAEHEPVITAKLVHGAIREEYRHFENEFSTVAEDDRILQKQRKAVLDRMENHYLSSGRKIGIDHMINLSASEPGMTVDINAEYDRNLLGCRNGIIDTLNGEFIPLEEITEDIRTRYPIHYIDCSYIPNAPKPYTFLSHLEMQFSDNTTDGLSPTERNFRCADSFRTFLRLLGYMLVAGNPERIFIFMWGKGRNGKSTTLEVLRNILGDEYGEGTGNELCSNGTDGPQPRMAEGIGRLVLSFPELSDNGENARGDGRIGIETIKLLTGEKSTTFFRKMGGYDGRLDILCTPIASTNDFPQFNKIPDQALLDRIITIPHTHRITDDELDTGILGKLMQEKDLIFSLMVNQCFAYRNGIRGENGTVREKAGLIETPDFWSEEQKQIMVGEPWYTYIKTRLRITDDPKSLELAEIKNDIVSYLLEMKIDEPKPIRDTRGYDYNWQPLTLSKGATAAFKKAMACCGFTLRESNGHRYYNAVPSRAALKNWNPNPKFDETR